MTTVPSGQVTIAANPNPGPVDSVAASLLTAMNNAINNGASLVSATSSVVGGVNFLEFPSTSGSVSVVGTVSTVGFLDLSHQATSVNSVVLNGSGTDSVFGSGQNGLQLVAGANTALDFYTNGGTGTVVATANNNLFGTPLTGSGAWDFIAGAGNDTVESYSGNNSIAVGTGNNVIGVGGGTALVASQGNDNIFVNGGAATIFALAGSSPTVSASAPGSLYFVNQSSGTSAVIFGGNSSGDYISGGTVAGGGGNFYGGSGGNNTLISGQGNTTMTGGGSGDLLSVTGSGADKIHLGAGGETVNASTATGQVTIFTYMGSIPGSSAVAIGSSGADTFWMSGNTNATLTGNGGADAYDVVKNQAAENITITDWTNTDTLNFYGYTATTFNAVSGGFQTTLSDGSVITIKTSVSSISNVHFN